MRSAPPPNAALADVFAAERRFLWGLCYRMTGSAADADDLVQETFTRALARPPRHRDRPWRPWLVRVALNLGRDAYRRRRRRGYEGPWLPALVPGADEAEPPAHEPPATAARYDLVESLTLAFLCALEALSPLGRAVLLLRDVFDYSARETAIALDVSEASVRVAHHRARLKLRGYDRARCRPTAALRQRTEATLQAFVSAVVSADVQAVEALLAADVRFTSDSDGEFHAARVPVVGVDRVARLCLGLGRRHAIVKRLAIVVANGLPGLWLETATAVPRDPPATYLQVELDADGRITVFHNVVASAKLAALRAQPA